MPRHLIAYDIADPGRLRRVARRLERTAVRVQKSVFVHRGDATELREILDDLAGLIDPAADVVQSWPVSEGPAAAELRAGVVLPGPVACAVLAPGGIVFLERAT